jgi:hypothetical protein
MTNKTEFLEDLKKLPDSELTEICHTLVETKEVVEISWECLHFLFVEYDLTINLDVENVQRINLTNDYKLNDCVNSFKLNNYKDNFKETSTVQRPNSLKRKLKLSENPTDVQVYNASVLIPYFKVSKDNLSEYLINNSCKFTSFPLLYIDKYSECLFIDHQIFSLGRNYILRKKLGPFEVVYAKIKEESTTMYIMSKDLTGVSIQADNSIYTCLEYTMSLSLRYEKHKSVPSFIALTSEELCTYFKDVNFVQDCCTNYHKALIRLMFCTVIRVMEYTKTEEQKYSKEKLEAEKKNRTLVPFYTKKIERTQRKYKLLKNSLAFFISIFSGKDKLIIWNMFKTKEINDLLGTNF